MIGGKLLSASAAVEPTAIEDVFSTYLYTGNGSTQTITNGIDLAGEGGLVWLKNRPFASNHLLIDTVRGSSRQLRSNETGGNENNSTILTSFNSDGFTLGVGNSNSNATGSGETYASWTFRQAPRFFDVVTYTGNGSTQAIAHALGQGVGFLAVKRTDSSGDWVCWHRGRPNSYLVLQSTAAETTTTSSVASRFGDNTNIVQPTSTNFTIGGTWDVNQSGGTYVAYLFAHDPLGPSGDGSDGLIACGSYTGNGSTQTISLGWEPQFVIIKKAAGTGDEGWIIQDVMRGMIAAGSTHDDRPLFANSSASEQSINNLVGPTATGFFLERGDGAVNASGSTYIYIAIRRGPMREPTVGTQVFATAAQTGNTFVTSGFPVDFALYRNRADAGPVVAQSRLTGGTQYLYTSRTSAEGTVAISNPFEYNNGFRDYFLSGTAAFYELFRRAPGFFDVVTYTGNGTLNPIGHNLTVNPELIIFKRRGSVQDWWVIHYATDKSLRLNTTAAGTTADASIYGPVTPTTFVPYLNTAGLTHISYHFASLPGISKVGSYTGNGSSQTINCGFTTGARFVLIKRTDSTGDWYVWDTARGIVSGNDARISLNAETAQVTSDDTIDPDNSGFIVNQVAATNVNVNAATYIYLAIA